MKSYRSFLGLLLVLSACAHKIEVEGHRGARGRLPENSLPGLQYALALGVDTLEFDLGVSKDRQLVLSHDPDFNSQICLGPRGEALKPGIFLKNLNYSEIRKYDCGSLKNPRFPQQRTLPGTYKPTLREVFEWIQSSQDPRAKTVKFNIETKITEKNPEQYVSPDLFARLLVEEIERAQMQSRVVVQSFDFRTLRIVRELNPKIKISALNETPGLDHLKIAQDLGAEIVSPEHILLTAEEVKKIQKAGIRVIPWTANDKETWQKLIDMKVDGIITDYPEELLEFLREKDLR